MDVVGDDASAALVRAASVPATLRDRAPEPAATRAAIAKSRAELVLVDDYDVSGDALTALRDVALVAAIDDLANRSLAIDLVINGALGASTLPYSRGPTTTWLLGEQYSLLRADFVAVPRRVAKPVSRVLVILGGTDPRGWTSRVVEAVVRALPETTIDAVVGPLAPEPHISAPNVVVRRAPADLPAIMKAVDLAVSGGGQTLFELAACGTPTIAIEIADNQRPQLDALVKGGVLLQSDVSSIGAAAAKLALDAEMRQHLADRAQALIDGRGAERVADTMLDLVARRRTHG
jgi:spore coat polysaccharide biosynthesis predicted glycosyltransferase SpsG